MSENEEFVATQEIESTDAISLAAAGHHPTNVFGKPPIPGWHDSYASASAAFFHAPSPP